MAAAVGLPLNIPVLIRSLGHDMFRLGMDQSKKFRPSIDLMVYLDGNITSHGPNDPSLNVTEFHNAWWNGRDPPSKTSLIFSSSQVGLALEHYQKQLTTVPPTPFPDNSTPKLDKPSYTWHQSAQTQLPIACTRCRLYRAVAIGVLDQLRDI